MISRLKFLFKVIIFRKLNIKCERQRSLPAPRSSACNGTHSRPTVRCISWLITGVAGSRSVHEQSQRCQERGSQSQELHLSTTTIADSVTVLSTVKRERKRTRNIYLSGARVEVSTWCSPSLLGWPVCAGPLGAWSPATVPLWLFSEFGTVYKYSDLLTYLGTIVTETR